LSKPLDHESFELLDQRDEEQILAEIKGQIITEMFYELTVGGKKVTGISLVGIKEISRKYGGISMGHPKVDDLGDCYAANILATDKRNDVTFGGTALQPKQMTVHDLDKNGSWLKDADGAYVTHLVPDSFAYTKAVSKARRNAIRALLPERYLIEMYQYFKNQKTGSKASAPKPDYREAEAQPSVPVRPDGNEVLGYLESCGYKAEQFQVWEDENEQKVIIKPIKYMGTDKWRNEMNELGAIYVKANKTYEVNM